MGRSFKDVLSEEKAHCCGLPVIQPCGQVYGGSDYYFIVHELVIWGLLLVEMDDWCREGGQRAIRRDRGREGSLPAHCSRQIAACYWFTHEDTLGTHWRHHRRILLTLAICSCPEYPLFYQPDSQDVFPSTNIRRTRKEKNGELSPSQIVLRLRSLSRVVVHLCTHN